VEIFSGAQDIGPGFRTAMAAVAAEELGLRPGDIKVNVGDTRWPEGPGSGGSNTTNTVGPVVRLGGDDDLAQLFASAAPLLQAQPDELAVADGKIVVAAKPAHAI